MTLFIYWGRSGLLMIVKLVKKGITLTEYLVTELEVCEGWAPVLKSSNCLFKYENSPVRLEEGKLLKFNNPRSFVSLQFVRVCEQL
jgi:hypothetical protein